MREKNLWFMMFIFVYGIFWVVCANIICRKKLHRYIVDFQFNQKTQSRKVFSFFSNICHNFCTVPISSKLATSATLFLYDASFVRRTICASLLAAALYPRRWKERQAPGETFRFKVRLPTYRRKTCIKTFPEFSRFYGTGQGNF